MQGNKRKDTLPELAVRRLLFADGLRYRVDYPLPFDRRRRADIVFPRLRIAIFIDGCFWHGCPEHYVPPKSNESFWNGKFKENRERDRDTNEKLMGLDWRVIRFWEHDDPYVVASKIAQIVRTSPA